MALQPGTRLGPYEIQSALGAGGMGEVYRALDSRLGRSVAIKIVKGQFSNRFEREARAISALNHPHICGLHDIGSSDGSAYLVMEFIEGRPLEGPLPVEKALEYGGQILDALDAAHQKGIVHRDLKPANILVTKSGVKLLDFGLAKQSRNREGKVPDETATMALTGEHTIVGTPQYMAPEQIDGREVDARTDIFAFGCVLYEMLTGKRAFDGKTPSAVMAAVLAAEPASISKLQPMAPPGLDRIVRTCLAKDPEQRWQSARDLRSALSLATEGRPAAPPPKIGRWWWAVAACALILGLALGWMGRNFRQPAAEARSFQLQVNPQSGTEFRLGSAGGSAISPDGRLLAYVASAGGASKLWVRPVDSLKARELPGTDGAHFPFWSPDSHSVGFFAEGKLKRIEASGGPSMVVGPAPLGRGGSWNTRDVIVYAPASAGSLYRISASGGTPSPVTDYDTGRQESVHRWPQFLPDGRRFLYFIRSGIKEFTGVYLGSLDHPHEKTRVISSAFNAAYARGLGTHSDYLLSVWEGGLVAQMFDGDHARLSGPAAPIADAVGMSPNFNLADFSVSNEGTLFYGIGTGGPYQLTWFSREGKALGSLGEPDRYSGLRISPDDKRVAVSITDSTGTSDLWQYELGRGNRTRFTFGGGSNGAWSPDSERIAYHDTAQRLRVKNASGAGPEERLTESPNSQFMNDWSPDGRFLVYTEITPVTLYDLFLLPLAGDRKPVPYLRTPFLESQGQFSPDGKWIAYTSDESGREEVYAQSFPASGAKLQISGKGGNLPRWRRDNKELFYRAVDGTLMAVPMRTVANRLELGMPSALFRVIAQLGIAYYPYDASADGRRFLAMLPETNAGAAPMTVVINWQAGLERADRERP